MMQTITLPRVKTAGFKFGGVSGAKRSVIVGCLAG